MFTPDLIIPFNKPLKYTSFDAVKVVKRHLIQSIKKNSAATEKLKVKVGHAGTLDPLATGLLVICTGKCTKQIEQIQIQEKEYTGTFYLGATTPSFDRETLHDQLFNIDHVTNEMIVETAKSFVGSIQQIPPAHSAIKVNGQRSYQLARAGKEKELSPRNVHIYSFEITDIRLPEIDFKIVCSKGTYIRSIARDFGFSIKSGAYLSALCRTRIGSYSLNEAYSIDNIAEKIDMATAISFSKA